MKTWVGLLVLVLILGCVSSPANDLPPVDVPRDPPAMEPPPAVTIPDEPPITDVDFYVAKIDGEIHIQSTGEKDLVYDPDTVCENGVCLLSMQYSLDVPDLTAHIHSTDFNILNKSDYSLNQSPIFTVAITEEPVMKTCIFSYAQNDHTYISNYFATFKHVCLFMDELATETGIEVHPNYALVWNSQHHTAGEYVGSDIIFLSQENPYKLSPTIMHELTHSLMEDAHFPNWMNEGLAEYYSDKALDIFHPKTKYAEGVEDWSFGSDDSNLNVSNQYYESSHTAVQNFAEVYGEDTLRELTHYFIEHPFVYSSNVTKIQDHTETILSKMRSLTGDEKIVSVEYLANLHKVKQAT